MQYLRRSLGTIYLLRSVRCWDGRVKGHCFGHGFPSPAATSPSRRSRRPRLPSGKRAGAHSPGSVGSRSGCSYTRRCFFTVVMLPERGVVLSVVPDCISSSSGSPSACVLVRRPSRASSQSIFRVIGVQDWRTMFVRMRVVVLHRSCQTNGSDLRRISSATYVHVGRCSSVRISSRTHVAYIASFRASRSKIPAPPASRLSRAPAF